MEFIKCPRCDLNYIQAGEKMCKICMQELKGSRYEEEIEYCSICNAAPALPGRDICLSCLHDMTGEVDENEQNEGAAQPCIKITGMNAMGEILPQIPNTDIDEKMEEFPELDDLPQNMDDMDEELSLESVIEDEEEEENQEDDEFDDFN